ncbi:MAG: arylamine N-acetyltransferase [Candidatus Krumholzibacteriia bacterium]
MNGTNVPVAEYLRRTGLPSLPSPTVTGLRDLVRAQSLTIAFENLDVLARRPIRLEPDAISEKILRRGRGGYCFELNGLLGDALQAAGFRHRPAMARVTYRRNAPGPCTHLVHLVECAGGTWLVDAGFGGPGLIEPLDFTPGRESRQNGADFRLVAEPGGGLHLQRKIAGEWAGLYVVADHPIVPADVMMANHFVSTWEGSPFRSLFMCALPVSGGLIAIQGTELVRLDSELARTGGEAMTSGADLRSVMRAAFGVEVAPDVAEAAWTAVVAAAGAKATAPAAPR